MQKPESQVTVRVHYPLGQPGITLRTDSDWQRDLQPLSVRNRGTAFDFRLDVTTPRYFKPVLRDEEATRWAEGANLLALPGAGRLDVYPYFTPDETCSVCEAHTLRGACGREHVVRVFLPPGYHENTLDRFPVLYMHDGQNLFFQDEAFGGHDWRIRETLDVLRSMHLIRKMIVVGVYPVERMRDYTADGFRDYGAFLVDRLKPWVDGRYRTLTTAADTAVMGSSLGGVVSLFLGWEWPHVFGRVVAMSSTFGFNDDLIERVGREPKRPLRIYLDSGWPADNYEVTRAMRNALVAAGYAEGTELFYIAWPQARHNEEAWAMRAHVPIQFFFGAMDAARPALSGRDAGATSR